MIWNEQTLLLNQQTLLLNHQTLLPKKLLTKKTKIKIHPHSIWNVKMNLCQFHRKTFTRKSWKISMNRWKNWRSWPKKGLKFKTKAQWSKINNPILKFSYSSATYIKFEIVKISFNNATQSKNYIKIFSWKFSSEWECKRVFFDIFFNVYVHRKSNSISQFAEN